jgi:hypothetical protein
MKIKAQTLKILVVNFGTEQDPWNLFCGIDENRIVFFKYLEMFSLPAYGSVNTEITFFRNREIINSLSPYISGDHGAPFRMEIGKHKIYSRFPVHQSSKLFSGDFLSDDIIEIEKCDWEAEDNPLSLISTRRSVGHDFHLVFHRDDIAKKIVEFSGMTYEELSDKSVIFENKPGESGRYISHF